MPPVGSVFLLRAAEDVAQQSNLYRIDNSNLKLKRIYICWSIKDKFYNIKMSAVYL